jgi:hypothetical protein
MTCVTPSENFFDGDRAGCFAKLLYIFDCLVDLLLPLMRLGDDASDRLAMPGDDDGLAPLDFIEQLRKVGFGPRRPELRAHVAFPIGQIDGFDMASCSGIR